MLGAAEVSFYNHEYVKAFNPKFIEIRFKLFKYSVGVPVCQQFDKTSFKESFAFTKFTEVKPGVIDSLRHLFIFPYNFVLRVKPEN